MFSATEFEKLLQNRILDILKTYDEKVNPLSGEGIGFAKDGIGLGKSYEGCDL